jgi:hypothetical protein
VRITRFEDSQANSETLSQKVYKTKNFRSGGHSSSGRALTYQEEALNLFFFLFFVYLLKP